MYGNRNFACAVVVCAGLLAVGFAARALLAGGEARRPAARSIARLAGCVVAFAACVFILLAAGSLAGYVAALVALLAYALCVLPVPRRHFVAGGLVAMALVALLVLFGSPHLQERMIRRTLGVESTEQARAMWWLAASDMFSARPLQGWGAGTYPAVYYRFAPPLADVSRYTAWKLAEHPHNEFLRVGAEGGLVGLALYVAAMGVALVASYRWLRRQRKGTQAVGFALWAGAIGFIAQACFGKALAFWDAALPFWMLLGVLGSASLWQEGGEALRSTAPAGRRAGVALCVLASILGTWFWWSWGLGGYRSMLELRAARGLLRAADRAARSTRADPEASQAAVARLSARAATRLTRAEGRCLWPPEVLSQRYSLGSILASAGRCREAVEQLRRVERAAPGALMVRYLLGRCYLALGERERARRHLRRFVARHPTYTPAYLELAQLDAREAGRFLLAQVDRERFAEPARVALLGALMAQLGLWADVETLLRDTAAAGQPASLHALAMALQRHCERTGQPERIEGLRKRFPDAFSGQPPPGGEGGTGGSRP